MNKPNLAKILKRAQAVTSKHSPEILTGIGFAGMVTTTVLAVKATPKALANIEEEKRAKHTDELTPAETVKVTWKCYIPAAVTCVASAGCLFGANRVSAKRTAALTAAYKISETALSEYQEAALKTVGEKKEQIIRERISQDRVEKHPVNNNEVIVTGKGNTLCLEPTSMRYFKSDIDTIKRVENLLNKQMLHDLGGSISLNDFYDEIGLDHTDVGDAIGWNANKGLIDIDFHSKIAEDGTPCIVLYYVTTPEYGYDKIY